MQKLLTEAVLVRAGAPAQLVVVDELEYLKRRRAVPLQMLDEVIQLVGHGCTPGGSSAPEPR